MELGNFGAIIGFALELEEQVVAFYEAAVPAGLEEPFQQLARGSRKRLKRLERARREGVSEMILEPIAGLDGDAYRADFTPQTDKAKRQHQAVALEEMAGRFYHDAATKMPILEIVRLFERFAEENEKRTAQIKAS